MSSNIYFTARSAENGFYAAVLFENRFCDLYYLCDMSNPPVFLSDADGCEIFWRPLADRQNVIRLGKQLGVSDADLTDPASISTLIAGFRPDCDFDDLKQDLPSFVTFGGQVYDCVLAALFFDEYFKNKSSAVTLIQRLHQWALMLEDRTMLSAIKIFGQNLRAKKIWENFRFSGRYLDLQKLNEKNASGLEKICALCGCSLVEPSLYTQDDPLQAAGYAFAEAQNLRMLYHLPYFKAQHSLKYQLLRTYPELVFEADGKTVRPDRLNADDRSAKFAAMVLSPYGTLDDQEYVSYLYPGKKRAAELGIRQFNVLEQAKDVFYSLYQDRDLRAKFDRIYETFKRLEGRNFNDSKQYRKTYRHPAESFKDLDRRSLVFCYYDREGNMTDCFANFSFGGIHGAMFNQPLYLEDCRQTGYESDLFVQNGPRSKTLNPRYVQSFAGLVNHEDFESYYCSLLDMMDAFENPVLKENRYRKLLADKRRYTAQLADPTVPEDQKLIMASLRAGSKLILNAASGAADTNTDNSIQMNNRIISMRIIGQLFAWQIGQAQAYYGAKVVSTNTDGLYTQMESGLNADILKQMSAMTGVKIEPEEVVLVSRDANNRMEADPKTGRILSASGSFLAGRTPPDPTRNVTHAPIADWVLAEYLLLCAYQYKGITLDQGFERETGSNILRSAFDKFDSKELMLMFQIVVSSGSNGESVLYESSDGQGRRVIGIRKVNRAFLVQENVPGSVYLHIAQRQKVSAAQMLKRKQKGVREQIHHPGARKALYQAGIDTAGDYEAVCKKVRNIPDLHPVLTWDLDFENTDEAEKQNILKKLNLDSYLDQVEYIFNSFWCNKKQ